MTAEPTHIQVLVGTNPVTYVWQPICKCWLARYYTGEIYCPLHGYPTRYYPIVGPLLNRGEEKDDA